MRKTLIAAVMAALAVTPTAGSTGSAEAVPRETHPINPVTGVALSPCVSSDNGDPDVVAVTLSTALVDVSKTNRSVLLTVRVSDTGGPGPASGVGLVTGALVDPRARHHTQNMAADADGLWRTTFRVPRHAVPGMWRVELTVRDHAGRWPYFSPASLSEQGLGAAFRVLSPGDRRAPRLSAVTLSRTSVNATTGRRGIRIGVRAGDPGSGVHAVTARLENLTSTSVNSSTESSFRRSSGTARDGRWTGRLTIPAWAPSGRWTLSVSAEDRDGNARSLPTGSAGSVLPVIRVRSQADHSGPRVMSFSMSAPTIDVRQAAQSVVIEVRAEDDASGLDEILVASEKDGIQHLVPAKLVKGTRLDGTWRATWTLGPCEDVAGAWSIQPLQVTDRAGNIWHQQLPPRSLDVIGDDRRPPSYTASPSSKEVRLDFTESVVGVTPSSRLMHFPLGYRSSLAEPVSGGSWRCMDTDGSATDCSTGPLRTAIFTPDQPLPPGWYDVEVNPEHGLDLTDLAGNPLLSRLSPSIQISNP